MANPSPFVQGLLAKATSANVPVKPTRPSLPAASVSTQTCTSKKPVNPFLSALNTDSAEYKEAYGVNRPLAKPMFLGYRNNQPLYGGGRLFILY